MKIYFDDIYIKKKRTICRRPTVKVRVEKNVKNVEESNHKTKMIKRVKEAMKGNENNIKEIGWVGMNETVPFYLRIFFTFLQ